jgi:hypothetical protein
MGRTKKVAAIVQWPLQQAHYKCSGDYELMRLSTTVLAMSLIATRVFAEVSLSKDFSEQVNSAPSSSSQSESDSSSSLPATINSQVNVSKNSLAPFVTDGCSMWIDGTPNQPWLWRHCCVAHDRAYWIGGTTDERRKSDQDLQKCVKDVAGQMMADYMYTLVIPGGSPYWMTPYRWGYGWSYFDEGKLRGFKTLSEEELAQAQALIPDAEKTIAEDAIQHPANFKITERHK